MSVIRTQRAAPPLAFALALACLATTAFVPPAFAHVTLEVKTAPAGAGYKAVFRVGHGCEGSATTTLKVELPEGVINAKPMPKPGWTLEIARGAYQKSYDYYGTAMTEGARSVTWTGKLGDDSYDEFVLTGYVAKDAAAGSRMFFPVTQLCETGAHRWVEIPAEGQDSHALKEPAPFITIAAPAELTAAPPVKVGSLTLSHIWLREPPPAAKTAGGYLSVSNGGAAADRLIGVESGIAGTIEVHEMTENGGVMQMRKLESGLEIGAGRTVELKPGGFHVMFMGLKEPLKAGATVPATLVFEKAGKVSVTFVVENAAQHGAAQEEHKH